MVKQHEIQREYADESIARVWAEVATREPLPGRVFTLEECHVDNIERVEKELARLNKIARAHGKPQTVVLFSPTVYVYEYREEQRVDGETVVRTRKTTNCLMIIIAPDTETIGAEGWRLVAVKTLVGGEGVVATLPGETCPRYYYTGDPTCDHCHTFRRRNEVFIVKRTLACVDGQDRDAYAQVGRQCLKEYTGITPEHALAVAAFYRATGEARQGSRYEENLDDYLPWVALVVRQDGRYWSRAAADDATSASYEQGGSYRCVKQWSTVDSVDHRRFERVNQPNMPEPTDEDRETAAKVKAWVATLDGEGSGYFANLQAVYRSGIVLYKHRGLICSAFAGYLREQQRMAEAAANRTVVRPSKWLGEQGDKVANVACRVARASEIDGNYGTTYLYRFVTPEGDKITWFSSNDLELKAGQEVRVSGTIKKLETYQGEQQTVLTRCRIA